MNASFTRQPQQNSMVTQEGPHGAVDLLCVECGWEGVCFVTDAAWIKFKQHSCKLRTESISTSW
jgi:hypothetical protein